MEAFFARPVDVVAPELLGSRLSAGGVTVELTEVEAYAGLDDPASHAFRGRTPRNAVMFGPPGRVYVYFIYGVHWAVNLVCQRDGVPAACLVRGATVIGGADAARSRRGGVADRQLARGPGNLASALGVSGELTGTTLWDGPVRWEARDPRWGGEVAVGPRVGVSRAAEVPRRFWVRGDPTVSAYRRSTRAGPAGLSDRP